MDLGTIRQKIENGVYLKKEEAIEDLVSTSLNLISSPCMTPNWFHFIRSNTIWPTQYLFSRHSYNILVDNFFLYRVYHKSSAERISSRRHGTVLFFFGKKMILSVLKIEKIQKRTYWYTQNKTLLQLLLFICLLLSLNINVLTNWVSQILAVYYIINCLINPLVLKNQVWNSKKSCRFLNRYNR